VLWIFVYGDNPWPTSASTLLMVLAVAASVITLLALVFAAYIFGKNREATGGPSARHIVIAATASVLIPALVLLQQWQVGNLGHAHVG
jgi:hypothetical protein